MTTPEIASPVIATRDVLLDSDIIDTAVHGPDRVHGGELPKQVIQTLDGKPPRGIVVKHAGSGAQFGAGIGDRDNIPVSVWRVDVLCYGRTRTEADLAALAVRHVLKGWGIGRTTGRAYVHEFVRSSGPIPVTDLETGWPISAVSFLVQMADELIPA